MSAADPNRAIPFFVDHSLASRDADHLAKLLDGITRRGSFTEGPLTLELERRIAAFTGAREAVAVGNGTDALIFCLLALGIGPGDEVVVPTFTFMASASSVANVGATPVFADVDPTTYNTTAELVRPRLTARTKAIMPVHLFTQMAPMGPLLDLAREYGLWLIEDSAEGMGMFQNGLHAGRFGKLGVLSFFPTKTLGGLGDGGMVLTDDPQLAERIRSLRSYGRDRQRPYRWLEAGLNSRLDEVQAAILLTRLDRLSEAVARRRHLARLYDRLLAPLAPHITPPGIVPGMADEPVYYVYVVECEQRDALVEHLSREGIGTETYYPKPLHLQPTFSSLGYRRGDLPHAERATTRTVALPLYPDLEEEEVERVVAAVSDFVHGSSWQSPSLQGQGSRGQTLHPQSLGGENR